MTLLPRPDILDDTQRQQLAEILRNPILCLAVDLTIRQAQPASSILIKSTPEQQAAIANQLAGMNAFLVGLQNLALPKGQQDLPLAPEEWDYEELNT